MPPSFPCVVIPLAAGVGVFVLRSHHAETRSRKLGTLATACGVAGFIPALLGPTFKDPEQSAMLAAWGFLTILFALAAVVLSIWTFRVRRRDAGVEPIYPVAGLLCGVANLFCGSGLLANGSGLLIETDPTPWTWRSAAYGFEVTIPSERWKKEPNTKALAAFRGSRPTVVAIVAEVRPARAEQEYEEALAYGRKVRKGSSSAKPDERSGPNSHGREHWLWMGDVRGDSGPYLFGVSITRVGDKAVVLMFEAPYRMISEAGREQESKAIRSQAEIFLGSVR